MEVAQLDLVAITMSDAVSPTPTLSLPKGGGAVKGIGETFYSNLLTG